MYLHRLCADDEGKSFLSRSTGKTGVTVNRDKNACSLDVQGMLAEGLAWLLLLRRRGVVAE